MQWFATGTHLPVFSTAVHAVKTPRGHHLRLDFVLPVAQELCCLCPDLTLVVRVRHQVVDGARKRAVAQFPSEPAIYMHIYMYIYIYIYIL